MRSYYDRCLVACALILSVSPSFAQVTTGTPSPVVSAVAVSVSKLSPAGIQKMTTADIAQLTTAEIQSLSMLAIATLSPQQIAAFTPTQIASFLPTQFALFTPTQLQALTATQIRAMTYGQFLGLSPAQSTLVGQNPGLTQTQPTAQTTVQASTGPSLANVPVTSMTPAMIAAYAPSQIATINPTDFANLSLQQIASLSPAQVQALTPQQLIGMTFTQLMNFNLIQFASLSPSQTAVLQANPSIVAGITAFNASNPTALSGSPYPAVMYQGMDVAPLIEFAKSDLRKVTSPFKLYHWDKGGQQEFWKTAKSGHNAAFARSIARAATIPFRALGRAGGNNNMYGGGFYLSVDPVATRSYGGGGYYNTSNTTTATVNQDWQMTELTIPAGVVFLDLNSAHDFTTSKIDLSTILSHFGCNGQSSANDFFRYGGSTLTQTCVDLVRFVYDTTLKIDLFSYNYGTTSFLSCQNGFNKRANDVQRAMVLTNGRWIKTENVFVMHASTTEDLETRRLIQTLMSYVDYAYNQTMTFDPKMAKRQIVNLLTSNPGSSIQAGTVSCSGSRCSLPIYACPKGTKYNDAGVTCSQDIVSLPAPKIATFRNADYSPYGLLWPDLEGQRKSSTAEVDSYLTNNRLGCDGNSRYENVATDAVKAGY